MKRGIRIILALFLFLGVSGALFQLLHPKLLAWYFAGYCHKCFGYSIDYETAKQAHDGSLLLKKVVAYSPDFPEGALRAHRIKISYTFDWWQRIVHADIFPDRLELHLKETPQQDENIEGKKVSFFKKKRRAFFFISPSIHLPKVGGNVLQGNGELLALFTVKAEVAREGKGEFVLKNNEGRGIIEGNFQEKRGKMKLLMHLEECPLRLLAQFWKRGLEVSSGIVQGEMEVCYENGEPAVKADLSFSHGALLSRFNAAFSFDRLSLQHSDSSTQLFVKNASLHWRAFSIDAIEGKILIKDAVFQPSSRLGGRFYGNPVMLSMEGIVGDPELFLQVGGKWNSTFFRFMEKYLQTAFLDNEPLKFTLHKKGTAWDGLLNVGEDRFHLSMVGKLGWKQEKGFIADIEQARLKSSPLSLKKYAPIMFQNAQGEIELEAVWLNQKLQLKQLMQGVHLSSEHFELHAHSPIALNYHWEAGKAFPLMHAKLEGLHGIDKRSGFSIEEIAGELFVNEQGVKIEGFGAQVEGITIGGRIEKPWNQDVTLHLDYAEGAFSGLKKIVSQLENPLFFHKLPIDGHLTAQGEGVRCVLAWDHSNPFQGKLLDLKAEGKLFEGTAHARFGNMKLDKLEFSFRFDQEANQLLLYDMEGSLFVGKEGGIDEYVVAGDKLFFSDFKAQKASFDVWVGLRNRDILRLAGHTQLVFQEGEPFVQIVFDHDLTHFGVIHPKVAQFTLKNWEEIRQMDVSLSFQLSTALADVQRFVRSGFLGTSPGVTAAMGALKSAKGDVEAHVHWKSKDEVLFEVKGEDIALGSSRFHQFFLKGKKSEKIWNIEELKLDELIVSADIKNEGTNLVFPFFGVHYDSTALVGSHGVYYSHDDHLEGVIDLIELDIGKMRKSTRLADAYDAKGKIRAKGKLRLDFLKQHWWRAEAYLNGKISGLEMQGISFADIDDVAIGYLSDQGVTLQALQTHVQRGEDSVSMYVERAGYDWRTEELWMHGVRFNIPEIHLSWAAKWLKEVCPKTLGFHFPSDCTHLIAESKKEEPLSGWLDVRLHPRSASVKLKLDEGWYYFKGRPHFLRDPLLELSFQEIKFSTLYHFNGQWVLFAGQTHSLDFQKGNLIFSKQFQKERPLIIAWRRTDEGGFWIEKAQGNMAGSEIMLEGSQEDANGPSWKLFGEIKVDLTQASAFFPYLGWSAMAKHWELGKGYALKGEWDIPKDAWDRIQFEGLLEGRQAEVMGYELDFLEGQLKMHENKLLLTESRIEDRAGFVEVAKVEIEKTKDQQWLLEMPLIVLHEFNPSQLRKVGKADNHRVDNNFVFKKLQIRGVRGYAANLHSWQAAGSFNFSHTVKKGERQTLFSIPNDILKNVGVDLTALVPVSGYIEFDIEDGKIIFSKFKDVYSENKLLKFSLVRENLSSMDFNGNLNLRLTLKPYHLMFRFAEFFSIGVTGTLRKPEYRLF